MASIATKFSIGDIVYTFNGEFGCIIRYVVKGITITTSSVDTEIMYKLNASVNSVPPNSVSTHSSLPEQDLYTESEVTDLANSYLIEKSVSIFSNAGL